MDNFLESFFEPVSDIEPETTTPEIPEIEEVASDPVETTEAEHEIETQAATATVEPKMVPLSAVQAERQKAKEAYDQVKALNLRIAEF